MWFALVARAGSVRTDPFLLSIIGVMLAATLAPCSGTSAAVVHSLGIAAIATLFFLQGARLSRGAVLDGITAWRLHVTIAAITFVLFPLTGLALMVVFRTTLPPLVWMGVLFLCALPSTVQASIALTSMAKGNVAGAICSATASNVAGIVLTPFIFGALSSVHGGSVSLNGVGQVVLELLVPFAVGHWLRPTIGGWVERHRRLLSVTDRGSILVVVYGALSGAVMHGIWQQLPYTVLLPLIVIVAFIFVIVLFGIRVMGVAFGFDRQDKIATLFCGTQKSLITGVPMANALFSATAVGPMLIPMMIYYPIQMLVCALLARRYAALPDAPLAVRSRAEDKLHAVGTP